MIVTSRRKNWFPISDETWRASLTKFQGSHSVGGTRNNVALPSQPPGGISAADRHRGKRLRVDAAAEEAALPLIPGTRRRGGDRLTLRQCETFEELCKSFDRVASPAQVAAVLSHELAQFVVLCVMVALDTPSGAI